jgi:hypothetical protein
MKKFDLRPAQWMTTASRVVSIPCITQREHQSMTLMRHPKISYLTNTYLKLKEWRQDVEVHKISLDIDLTIPRPVNRYVGKTSIEPPIAFQTQHWVFGREIEKEGLG